MNTLRSGLFASPVVAALVVGASLVGGMALTAHSSPAPAAAPVSVAVVDIAKLINGLKELEDRNMGNKPKLDEYNASLKQIKDRIEKLTSDLNDKIPQKDYTARSAAMSEKYELETLYETRFKIYQRQLDVLKGDTITLLYNKSLVAIEAMAKKEGIDLVMIDDRSVKLPEVGQAVQRDVFGAMDNKRMLYVRDGMDITDRLISLMNEQYLAGPRAANPPANTGANPAPASPPANPAPLNNR
ncbi:MAG TPA: OmpH family outer membrane protein [Phycisphaerales bacterium]|nr:OmpH family outer membrane protein [Phycisphaerales bacterium]